MGRPSAPHGLKGGPGFAKIVEDTSDAEDDRLNSVNGGKTNESEKLKECNINMTARQIIDSCKGWLFFFFTVQFLCLLLTEKIPYLTLFDGHVFINDGNLTRRSRWISGLTSLQHFV